jgi:hypothetical protein
MAGDWLKIECNLPEKPEVLAITVTMGWDDPDVTVGKLVRVWRWFDQHTIDGNAPGVTAALLDRLIGVTGLCAAMAKVGWLLITDAGLSLPNFDRHNGKTAKDRALTAKRVATHKAKAEGNAKGNAIANAASVSGALPREEKRREEEIPPIPPKGGDVPGFAAFWAAWPTSDRKQAKGKCLEAWKKAGAEPQAALVVAHVERMKSSSLWTRDGGQYIPAPLVYLNQRRWEGADDQWHGGGPMPGDV